jgi:hypothetical protein
MVCHPKLTLAKLAWPNGRWIWPHNTGEGVPRMFKEICQKRYRAVLAIVFLLAAGAALFIGWNDSVIRSFGVLACMASAYFFRTSKVKGRSDEAVENCIGMSHETTDGPSRLLWILSGVWLGMQVPQPSHQGQMRRSTLASYLVASASPDVDPWVAH